MAALAALCALSNRGLLGSQVLPIALAKGRVSEGPLSRATCCKILGCLAPRLVSAAAPPAPAAASLLLAARLQCLRRLQSTYSSGVACWPVLQSTVHCIKFSCRTAFTTHA